MGPAVFSRLVLSGMGHTVFSRLVLSVMGHAVFSSLALSGMGHGVFSRLCASPCCHMCWSGRKCPALRRKMVHGPQSMFYNPTVLPHLQRSRIKVAATPMEQNSKNSCGARPSKNYDFHAEHRTMNSCKTLVSSFILSRLDYCSCLFMGASSPEKSKLCCKTRSLGTPSPPLNTSPGKKKKKNCTGCPFQNVLSTKLLVCVSVL